MSNRLDPGQARRFVGPDLGQHCLQNLSADDISRQLVKTLEALIKRISYKIKIEAISWRRQHLWKTKEILI